MIVRPLFNESNLLTDIVDSVYNLESLERCLTVVTDEGRSRRDCLVRLVCVCAWNAPRGTHSKMCLSLYIPGLWLRLRTTLSALLSWLCFWNLYLKTFWGISRGKSLLRSMVASTVLTATEGGLSHMQGVGNYVLSSNKVAISKSSWMNSVWEVYSWALTS